MESGKWKVKVGWVKQAILTFRVKFVCGYPPIKEMENGKWKMES